MKLAYAFCGSFCTHARSLEALTHLSAENDIYPVFSEITDSTDTRFGSAEILREKVFALTGRKPIKTIREAEDIITRGSFDSLIISPCTGNTLAKIAHGITDSVVTMSAKAMLRNRRPLIIALATNDGLNANLGNIALTLEKKNIYFVPFGQDDCNGKPNSLICDFTKIPQTLEHALSGKQIQPLLI